VNGEAEERAWIDKLAERIEAMGLSPMALFLIEIARPFGFLGSQMLLMARPLLAGVADDTAVEHATTLLDNPELLNRLSIRLEGEKTE
jgi:hypothetical protein